MPPSLEDTLSVLEQVTPINDYHMAICPCHSDRTPSLIISHDGVLNCFAGCDFKEIWNEIESRLDNEFEPIRAPRVSSKELASENPLALWLDLFNFSPNEIVMNVFSWEDPGEHIELTPRGISFLWPGMPQVRKTRTSNPKQKFFWTGQRKSPPLWPQLPDEDLPEDLFLTEGESDALCLIQAGFPAFALTKGANTPLSERLVERLMARGVKRLTLCFDDDDQGHISAQKVFARLLALDIEVRVLPIGNLTLPELGEKDIRDIFLRLGVKAFREEFIVFLEDSGEIPTSLVTFADALTMDLKPSEWLVERLWVDKTVGLLTGWPKVGKSFLVLDMALSIATGTDCLNAFPVKQGGVVFVALENTLSSLMSRAEKILDSRDLLNPKTGQPKEGIPIAWRAQQEFSLDPTSIDELATEITMTDFLGFEPKLIVIDPLGFALPTSVKDFSLNDFQSAALLGKLTQRLRDRTGCAVLIVHHSGKAEYVPGSALGSTGLFAFAESFLGYVSKEPDDDGYFTVDTRFRDAESEPFKYKTTYTDGKYATDVIAEDVPLTVTITTTSAAKRAAVRELLHTTLLEHSKPGIVYTFRDLYEVISHRWADDSLDPPSENTVNAIIEDLITLKEFSKARVSGVNQYTRLGKLVSK